MLPAERRVRRREDFAAAVRHGQRASASGLVVHLCRPGTPQPTASVAPARAGFIVGRAVGPAVTRNRVRRRLRHLLAPRLETLPNGALVVVRATPAAAMHGSRELGATLDRLLSRLSSEHSAAGSR